MKLFNLNVGVKIDNSDIVADLISRDSFDIVTLQETMRKLDENVNPLYDSCNIIKNKTNYENSFFGALWVAERHMKNGVVTKEFGGNTEQGNQTLTSFPILKSNNIFYYKEYSKFEDTTNFREVDHPRAFTDVIINAKGKDLQIINVHGTWNKDKIGNERSKIQTKAILDNVRFDIPCIVVGDFNLLPDTTEIKQLSERLTNLIDKYNIKSTRPDFDDGLDTGNMVCDYIFVNDKVKVNNFFVIISDVSDHYPLVLDFEI